MEQRLRRYALYVIILRATSRFVKKIIKSDDKKLDFFWKTADMAHVNRIREKIEDDPKNPQNIETVLGSMLGARQ